MPADKRTFFEHYLHHPYQSSRTPQLILVGYDPARASREWAGNVSETVGKTVLERASTQPQMVLFEAPANKAYGPLVCGGRDSLRIDRILIHAVVMPCVQLRAPG